MMKLNRWIFFLCLVVLGLQPLMVGAQDHKEDEKALSVDGPYVLYDSLGRLRMVSVSKEGVLKDTVYAGMPGQVTFTVTPEKVDHPFEVTLHAFKRPQWKSSQPAKILVLSDPHGDFKSFISILEGMKVVDRDYRWSFGANRLVIIGDVFDRGVDVLPIYWLIYKLEQEAADAGGEVCFMLGNHEEMVLRNDLRYAKGKYLNLAKQLGVAYPELWNEASELGRWLRTRNLIQQFGTNLFVHAGFSTDFLKLKKSVEEINAETSASLGLTKQARTDKSPLSDFIFKTSGPFWYRGMVRSDDKYLPIPLTDVNKLLKRYKARRIFVGHTIFDDITTFYNKRVVAVNVDNKENWEKKRGRGVLLEGDSVFVIYDSGKLEKIVP